MDCNHLVGCQLEFAEAFCESNSIPYRLVKVDGQYMIVTRDYRPERLNFEIENNIISKVSNG